VQPCTGGDRGPISRLVILNFEKHVRRKENLFGWSEKKSWGLEFPKFKNKEDRELSLRVGR